jgi:hypothetical protein
MLALMAKGQVSGPGVFPPEVLARRPEVAQAFLGEYQSRGIQVHHRAEPI